MISVPLPLFLTGLAALMAVLVITRSWLGTRAKTLFVALAAVMMIETILVALRFAYQIEGVLVIQRLLPFWIGPLLYLGFLALSDRAEHLRRLVVLHLGWAAAFTLVVAAVPQVRIALDFLIAFSYAFYAVLLMRLWRGGPDRLSQLAVAHIPKMRRFMVLGVLLLAVTCLMDTVIAVDFIHNEGANVTRMLSLGSLILIALFAGAAFWIGKAPTGKETTTSLSDQDDDVVTRATQFLEETRLFTDPDLSLTRLARRIGVTDRVLSTAVNRQTGKNVSQFINGFRVTAAADLLRATNDPVSAIGEAAGFLTRSNFYTEFQRAYGQSPGAYRKG